MPSNLGTVAQRASVATKGYVDDLTASLTGGGQPILVPTAKNSAYTAAVRDLVLADASTAAFTVTLPPATGGGTLEVKKVDSSANVVTVAAQGSDTVGSLGAASVPIRLPDQAMVLQANGTNWIIVDGYQSLSSLDGRYTAASTVSAPSWAASTSYRVGDLVWQAATLRRANTAHTSAATFSGANWDLIGPSADVATSVPGGITTGPMAWFRGEVLGRVRRDTIPLTDGSVVAFWEDSSGGGYTASTALDTQKATYYSGIANGYGVARCGTSSDTALASPASSSYPSTTIFAVVRPTSGGLSGRRTIRGAGGPTGNGGGLGLGLNAGKPILVKQTAADIGTATTAISSTSFTIVCATFVAATSWAFYRNGAADGTGTASVSLDATRTTMIGSNTSTGGEGFIGDIAELIVYNSVLSTADRTSVTAYLGTKYGITVT